ncbi:unnamed protein product [Periconia digitata]|uniref:Uncharacterized protein n=1 Tax=Periconia digitata TaxID=1303443 RepID=A0A9W4UB34_9PLEO|nr:unnamed protein product [Periconia digitata]
MYNTILEHGARTNKASHTLGNTSCASRETYVRSTIKGSSTRKARGFLPFFSCLLVREMNDRSCEWEWERERFGCLLSFPLAPDIACARAQQCDELARYVYNYLPIRLGFLVWLSH